VALSLARIVVARLAARRRAVAPLFGAFLLAIALLVVLPETAYLSAGAGFQSLLQSMPLATSAVQVLGSGLDSDQAITDFESDVRQRAAVKVHGYLREAAFRVASGEFPLNSHNGAPVPTQGDREVVLAFANHSDLQSHADLVAGAWAAQAPTGTFSVTLPDTTAARLNAKPGDRLCVANGTQAGAICVAVAGIWRQRNPTSAYWLGDDSLSLEAEMSRADLAAPGTQSTSGYHQATEVLVLDLARIEQSDPAAVQETLPHLGSALTGNLQYRVVVTGLDTAIATFDSRSRVATFALQIVTAQLWLFGLYCLLFLVGIRLEQDRDAVAVLRTRGWPRRLVAGLLSIELVLVAALAVVPGIALGFGLALAITAAVYPIADLSIGPSIGALAPIVGGGLVVLALAIVGLSVAAARAGVVRSRTEASRPAARWWSRPWVAALAAALAIPILAQARVLGDARIREAGGGLPYDLLLPGVGMALVAYAGIVLLPPTASAFGRVIHGIEAKLAVMQLARASGRQQRLSILLVAAVALALLAAAYSGTAALNASDRAGYAVGADLRVVTRGQQPTELDSLRVAGAAARTDVYRGYAGVGANLSQMESLAVDPYAFAKTAWSRPGLLSPDLATLMHDLAQGETGGTLLPPNATGLSIWIRGEQTGGSLTASFTDANMMPVTADFGTLDFTGWQQRTSTFSPSQFKGPLRLRHLTLTPVSTAGTVALSDLEATSSGASKSIYGFDSPALAPVLDPWWVSDGTSGMRLEALQGDDRFLRDGVSTSHVFLSPGWLPVTLNPPVFEITPSGSTQSSSFGRVTSLRVPVLVSSGVLAANQARVGDSISMQFENSPVNTLIVGSFDYFPTLYGDGVVFSLPLLLQLLGGEGSPRPWPSELWVAGPAPQLQADEAKLTVNPAVVSAVSRSDLEQQAAADPIGPAGRVNLLLGFAAACVLAVAAFAIYFAFAARSRRSEYAILQANGLSPGQIARSLLIEQLLIVGFSTLLGLVVGSALSLVILPGLEVSTSLADTIPPTVLAVNPWLAIGGIAITIVACMFVGGMVARSSRVADIMPELRSLG
jgi:hypothetical protein